ncbi:MAG: UvrD-helicase domain-containing protein [Eubacterium sp.]|nr:UvrD-helicase domain-containing protein [Eubacterium sp.]
MAGKTKWNKGQQEVLDSLSDKRNILVSAAAGSGKTAVLVERIIRTIESGQADIDEILVVTFTKMAAAQMKAKIIRALEKLAISASASSDSSDNQTQEEKNKNSQYAERISRQLLLADKANISTIDSFCNSIVRENFSLVDMDPSFDVFDKDEIELLKNEVLDEVLDKYYKDDETFGKLTQFLVKKNIDDTDLKKLILKIFNVADSFADYDEWFSLAREEHEKPEHVMKEKWVNAYLEYMKTLAFDYAENQRRVKDYFDNDINPDRVKTKDKIINMLEGDIDKLTCMAGASSIDQIKDILSVKWATFPKKPALTDYDNDLINRMIKTREKMKDELKKIYTSDAIIEDYKNTNDYIRCLISITSDFRTALVEEKNKYKKYEFSDIAHAAYNILYDKDRGLPTEVGLRMADDFKYIYVDEYQDSSDLQENLLYAIARRDDQGKPMNIFMVGDVKQSIYRFRQARPQLFFDKSERYDKQDGGRLITLNMNYRSRREVLEATNFIFENLMTKGFGGTDYNNTVALHTPEETDYKNNYSDSDLNVGGCVELKIINTSNKNININSDELEKSDKSGASDKATGDSISENKNPDDLKVLNSDNNLDNKSNEDSELLREVLKYTNAEIEAIEIGRRIKELIYGDKEKGVDPIYVKNEAYDSSRSESSDNMPYRRASFGDIVILQRKNKGSEEVLKIFEQMEIPAVIEDASGFFDAMEIITIISILRIIDNQEQDIPLTSVLLSHIGGFTDEELTIIVNDIGGNKSLTGKCQDFIEKYEARAYKRESDIASRLKLFNQMLDRWKNLRPYITISDLIKYIVKDTDYEGYVMSMPEGRKRVANIRMLQMRAEKFERSDAVGLMDFIRYIDKCRIQDIDFAEDKDTDTVSDSVRIMTIHKSKGLEFPIVFVSRLGGQFNMKDTEGLVAVDSDYYIAMDSVRKSSSGILLRRPGIKKQIVKMLSDKEVKEEEMRLLYVAMTRAKEKLILVGTYTADPPGLLMNSKSYLDYIRKSIEISSGNCPIDISYDDKINVVSDFRKVYSKKSVDYTNDVKKLLEDIRLIIEKSDKDKVLADNPYDYIYEWEQATKQKAKLSVSEIKHAEMESRLVIDNTSDIIVDNLEAENYLEKNKTEKNKTENNKTENYNSENNKSENNKSDKKSGKKSGKNYAAIRGTAIHAVFEKLDYSKIDSEEEMKLECQRILESEAFTDEERKLVDINLFLEFYSQDEDSLFYRMKKAFSLDRLRREQQFITGLTPDQIPGNIQKSETKQKDFVIIQGIIDAFFYEGNDIILVDYKTDNVKNGQELLDRYASQMYLYGLTLEELTGHKVADCILYSTKLGEVHYTNWREYINER